MNIESIIVSFVSIAIGIGVSLYFYLKQKEAKEPQCYYKTYKNIEKLTKEDNLKVTYNGIEVERVSTTYIFFWNKGRKPIRKDDIIDNNLLVSLSDKANSSFLILEMETLKNTRDSIKFSTFLPEGKYKENGDFEINKIQLGFEFLDKNDGAVIEVKHTGGVGTKVQIESTLLGVPDKIVCKKIKGNYLARDGFLGGVARRFSLVIGFSVLALSIIGMIFYLESVYLAFSKNNFNEAIPTFLISIAFGLIPFIFALSLPRIPYPKSLEIDVDFKP